MIIHLACQQAFGSVLDSAQTSQLPPSSYEVKIVESSELDYASHVPYYSALLKLALSKTEDPIKPTYLVRK